MYSAHGTAREKWAICRNDDDARSCLAGRWVNRRVSSTRYNETSAILWMCPSLCEWVWEDGWQVSYKFPDVNVRFQDQNSRAYIFTSERDLFIHRGVPVKCVSWLAKASGWFVYFWNLVNVTPCELWSRRRRWERACEKESWLYEIQVQKHLLHTHDWCNFEKREITGPRLVWACAIVEPAQANRFPISRNGLALGKCIGTEMKINRG